jgi:hypothetical protein
VIYVDFAFWQEVVDIKSGGVRNIRTLEKRTGEREEGEVACYVSALDPVFLRSDFDPLSEAVVQQEGNEEPRCEVLGSIPNLSLFGQQLLNVLAAPSFRGQRFNVGFDCELGL